MPTTVERVKGYLKLQPLDAVDDALLADVVAATNSWVARIPWVAGLEGFPAAWDDRADQGATMLAARLYRRRNTPSGVETFTDSVVYVPRRDSDVDMLLRTGSHATPQAG